MVEAIEKHGQELAGEQKSMGAKLVEQIKELADVRMTCAEAKLKCQYLAEDLRREQADSQKLRDELELTTTKLTEAHEEIRTLKFDLSHERQLV